MKKRSLNIFDAGIAFVMSYILATLTAVVGITICDFIMSTCGLSSTQIELFWNGMWGYLFQGLFMNGAFVGIFIWYYLRREKQPILENPNKTTLKYVGYCILFGIATLFLLSGSLSYFQLMLEKLGFNTESSFYEINSPLAYIISLFSLAVLPAICEELLFRGLITTALKEKGETFAIWTSSIMFAIFHFSPLQLIYPLCFGLILSIVYLRTKNIVFPILLHFINNALSISIQYFSNSSGGEFIHSTATLMYSIITLVIWIVIIRYMFKDFKQYKSNLKALQDNLKQNEFFENATIVDTSTNNTDQKPTTSLTLANDSLNDKILYGSIILMGLIYILLLFA